MGINSQIRKITRVEAVPCMRAILRKLIINSGNALLYLALSGSGVLAVMALSKGAFTGAAVFLCLTAFFLYLTRPKSKEITGKFDLGDFVVLALAAIGLLVGILSGSWFFIGGGVLFIGWTFYKSASKGKTVPFDLPYNFVRAAVAGLLPDHGIYTGGFEVVKIKEGEETREVTKLLRYDGDKHLCTFAPSGSGKMTTVQSAVLLMQDDRSLVVIDPKGQLAAITAERRRKLGHKVICLNPFKLHQGEPWNLPADSFNPLSGLDLGSPSFSSDAERLAAALVEVGGEDSHWGESARDVVAFLIMWVIVEGEDRTLNRVRDLLSLPDENFCDLAKTLSGRPELPAAIRNKAGAVAEPNRTTQGVLSTARTQTRFLDDALIRENLKESGFDFAQLKRELTTVYLILPADYIASHNKWLRVMIASALSAFYRNPQGNRVLFMLDEFAQLGYLDDIRKGAGLIRDYGVQLWPFFQDWNQAKGIYKDFAESLIANCGVVQCFTPGDDITAKWIAGKVGQWKDMTKSYSTSSNPQGGSSGTSSNEFYREYTPQEITAFLRNNQLIFKDGRACLSKRFQYYETPSFAELAKPNPYPPYRRN